MLKRSRNALILMVIFVLGLGSCGSGPEPVLRLGTNIWPGYEPLYLAQSIGKLPRERVRLIEYPSASEVIRAFRNQSLEAASLTLDEALLLRQAEIPVKIILVHDVSAGGDVIMARPGIDSVAGLKGRRVGVESGALGAYVITRALEIHGLSPTDVKIAHLDVNAHEQAYLKDEVDAVVTFEPVRTKLLRAGAGEIFTSREMPGEIVDVLVVRESVLKEQAGTLRMLIDAWFDALDYLDTQREEAAKLMAKRQHISPAEVLESLQGLELPSRAENMRMLDSQRGALDATIVKLSGVLRDKQLLRKDVSVQGMTSAELLR